MTLSNALQQAWYRPTSWSLCLLPLSWLFRLVAMLRRFCQQRLSPSPALPVPVIVVGNISVGGTGKTPLLTSLVDHFIKLGYRPGVISRGYGGDHGDNPMLVTSESTAEQVGDEPLLLACHCPVVVCKDRYRAGLFLLEHTDCDLIMSDDGLQHYRLPRDIELVVVDGERGFGNRHCLPAGPLREPVTRLEEVDFVLVNGSESTDHKVNQEVFQLLPVGLRHLKSGTVISPQQWQGGKRVHAVAGIGNPQRFARSLKTLGLEPILHPLPDHHVFTGEELSFDDDLPVIITAKDAVKCAHFGLDNIWVLDVTAVLSSDLLSRLAKRVAILKKST